jgi:thiamine biosynthesis lipoprotein
MSGENRPTRRDFLQGRAAVQALAVAVGGGNGGSASDSRTRQSENVSSRSSPTIGGRDAVVSFRRRAMACEFEVQLPAAARDGATEAAVGALDLVDALEDQLTVYRADSELICVNRQAAARPVAVEPRLFAILQLAERLYRETDGAFDITSGPLSEVWGFSRRQGRLPSDAEIAGALERVGMEGVVLDAANRTVSFRRPGVTLHLNCVGKGYALDRMAEQLDAERVGDYLLHGGRSSVLGRGDCPGGSWPGWTIGVPHPLRQGARLAEIQLVNQALGTSGSGRNTLSTAAGGMAICSIRGPAGQRPECTRQRSWRRRRPRPTHFRPRFT